MTRRVASLLNKWFIIGGAGLMVGGAAIAMTHHDLGEVSLGGLILLAGAVVISLRVAR